MHTVSIFEAKTHLSRIVESLVSANEDRVVISRRGEPVALLTRLPKIDITKRIGVAHGCFVVPDNIDRSNETIASMFAISSEGE